MKAQSRNLEQYMRSWENVFHDQTSFDRNLVKGRVLDNTDRPLVKPTIRFLTEVQRYMETWKTEWGLPGVDKGFANYLVGVKETAEQYLLICAACNTVCVHFKAANAVKMAEEVLIIVDKKVENTRNWKKPFVLPPVLKARLQCIASGRKDEDEVPDVKQARKSKKVVKQEPKAEKSKPSAPIGNSVASSSLALAVPPGPDNKEDSQTTRTTVCKEEQKQAKKRRLMG